MQAAKAAATKQRPPSWPKTQFAGHEGGLRSVAVALAAWHIIKSKYLHPNPDDFTNSTR